MIPFVSLGGTTEILMLAEDAAVGRMSVGAYMIEYLIHLTIVYRENRQKDRLTHG